MADLNAKMDILLQRTENMEQLSKKLDSIDNQLSSTNNKLDHFCHLVTKLEQQAIDTQGKLAQYKQFIDHLISKDKVNDKENKEKQHAINKLEEQYKLLKIEVNKKNQYDRSNYNVLMGGVPLLCENETAKESQDLVCKIAKNAKIPDFSPDDIDLAHRLPSRNSNTPMIIIRFKYKAARQRFFSAKQSFKKLSAEKLLSDEEEVSFNYVDAARASEDAGKIFLTESLSELNGELLRQAKEIAKPAGYKFYGYTVAGEVRVKKTENSRFISIKYFDDLAKIV